MKKLQSVLGLLSIALLCILVKPLYAQQSRVDSIVEMLGRSKTGKGIDTAIFLETVGLLEKTNLNDENIAALEKTALIFNNGDDEQLSYRVKYSILNSLISTDKSKSLVYGKKKLSELESSKLSDAYLISSAIIKQLRIPYRNSDMLNEGFGYFNEKLVEYKLRNDSVGLANCYYVLAGFYRTVGLLDQAIYHMKKSVSYMSTDTLVDKRTFPFTNPVGRNMWLNNIGVLGFYYLQKGEYEEAMNYIRITYDDYVKRGMLVGQNTPNTMAQVQLLSGRLDSVMHYLNLLFNSTRKNENPDYLASALQIKGFYKIKTGELEEAEEALQQSWQLIRENRIAADARPGTMAPDYYLALIRVEQGKLNEAIALLEKDIERLNSQRLYIMRDYKLLAEVNKRNGNLLKSNEALSAYIGLVESLQADQEKYGSLSFETEQEMNAKELSITKLQSENKIAALTKYFSFGIAALVLALAGVIYYRFKSKQKANIKLEQTLLELQTTQKQLIQSEKMASLGELTAGIAHEIQNPLNFVNNFSEINKELLAEAFDELRKGDIEEAKSILNDVSVNEEKINHHGKRADAIVKGMMQHSRTSGLIKEPTDINKLADEYLRLAYHGLRAKDNSFNATLHTDFDESIGNINIIPQDIGRVVLNIVNNAFHAVNEKKKSGVENYEPAVAIGTRKEGGNVLISVKDNGNGIPQKILDKIFQPFFTTKPTGQGTGLGLSLSYDIVMAHGGEIKVKSEEGVGSEFIIVLKAEA
jgi:signal transduction histidine kinase